MSRWVSRIRRPVRREGVELYLLLMLLSFGGSVALTRLLLELTGYPQLGSGGIHIAHVLWGGLLLYLAALLPLILANRWVYVLGAVLGGVGVGLFIDEVGKFITQTNDYFEPLAAPIIYAFVVLSVLLYFRVSRPVPRDPRAELYQVLEAMEEVLDHDLDAQERQELELRLKGVAQDDRHPAFSRPGTSGPRAAGIPSIRPTAPGATGPRPAAALAAASSLVRTALADPPSPAGRPGRGIGCPGSLLECPRGRTAAGGRVHGEAGGEALGVGGAGSAAWRARAGSVLASVGSGRGGGRLDPAGRSAAA